MDLIYIRVIIYIKKKSVLNIMINKKKKKSMIRFIEIMAYFQLAMLTPYTYNHFYGRKCKTPNYPTLTIFSYKYYTTYVNILYVGD